MGITLPIRITLVVLIISTFSAKCADDKPTDAQRIAQLENENAALRERVAALEAQIKQLEAAVVRLNRNMLVETENRNFRRAKEWGEKAFNAGKTFVSGKEEIPATELTAVCKEPCYNIIYVRNRKDKRGRDDSTQVEYSKDRLVNIDIPSVSRDEDGWHMVYTFAENRSALLVRAQKTIMPEESDTVNKRGTITVMVRADEDEHFKRALEAVSPEEK